MFDEFLNAPFGDTLFFTDEGARHIQFGSQIGGFDVASSLRPDPVLFG